MPEMKQVINFYKRQKEFFSGIIEEREREFDPEAPPKV